MKIRNVVLPVLAIVACWLGSFTTAAFAKPRPPQPPWPQATLKIFGFDSPYLKVPWREVALNEEESTLVESWSGFALERSGLFLSPIVIPVQVSEKEVNVMPARGSIRFWLAPNWSTANEKSDGKGPGHLAHLLELVNLDGKVSDARWALFLNEAGDTLHFVGQTKPGLTEILQAPVEFTAGDWRMITLCYSETNTVLLLDNEVIAKGEGVLAPAPWEEKSLGLVIGSDVLASPDSLAEAQFEELTTMRQWPSQSDWQTLYFQATKRRSLLGALGTKEEEQAKVVVLKAAGLLPEDYGLAKNSGEGDGPIVAYSYAEGTLWLEIAGVSNNLAYLIVHGTVADTAYEILSKDSLTNVEWAGEQPIVLGAAGQDWTPTTVTVGTRTNNLFLWARTLVDTDGDGLPDWWELAHNLDPNNPDTGNTGVSDGYKDSDNDGWTNLQEYQNGTSPSQFNTPPPPQGLVVRLDASGTNTSLSWQSASGPAISYTIERSYPNDLIQVTNATSAVMGLAGTLPELFFDSEIPAYRIQAHYANGSSAWGEWKSIPELASPEAAIRSSAGNIATLIVQAIPTFAAAVRVGLADYDWNTFEYYSVESAEIALNQFTNGAAVVPAAFALSAATNNLMLYIQYVLTNSAGSAMNVNGTIRSFWDGRAQLKDNLRFLLRSATPFGSFGFVRRTGNDYDFKYAASPENYAYAGYYDLGEYLATDDPYPYPWAYTDPLRPFRDNYLYRNFAFGSTNLDASGKIKTGVYWESGTYNLYLLTPEQWVFQPPSTASTIPSVLTSGQAQWTAWLDYYRYIASLPGNNVGVTVQNDVYQMTSGARNLFGLPYVSIQLAWGSNVTDIATLSPGNNVYTTMAYGHAYPETAQPAFQPVDYYFARQHGDWYEHTNEARLPGHAAFSPTNTSPLLITSVDDPSFRLSGYAKLAVTNGYAGVYGYLGQYFDKAYKTTNGVVTTNQTGILSPYGEFFPTEPGRVALVTMPDLDTGARGTATVYCVKMELDVNHDGTIDRTFAGPDNTSQNRPFRFWLNNDRDLYEKDLNTPNGHNHDDNVINGFRDLEDFARLWVSGLPALPSAQGYSVSLSWRNTTGNPAIKLYHAHEVDGGTGYLSDTNVALQQLIHDDKWLGDTFPGISLPGPFGAGPFTFPSNYFAVQGTNAHFLFEGAGIGSGELVLTISKGTNVLAETSAWFDLRDIKDMYEQVDIRNVTDATPNTLTSTYRETKVLSDDASEDKSVILFVHGWRMGVWDYHSFSESMFKRLYWQGFKGRFAALRWPTLSHDDFNSLVDVLNDFQSLFTYNKSEFRAFQSGRGVSDYFTHLRQRFPDRTIGVCAHSMGGIVTMQALRLQLAASQTNIDNLIIMQAAVPAHCYDSSLPNYAPFLAAETNILSMRTPDTYRSYPGAINGAVRNQIVNFFNTNDFALATGTVQGFGSVSWEGNEISYKPDQGFGYSSDGTNAYKSFVLFTDARQIMSFVARPRSKAVGALPGVNGVIHGGQVDLKGNFGFDADKSEHSAQFNWNIHRLNGFYSQLLTDLLQ